MNVNSITKVDKYRRAILRAAYESGEPQHLASCMSIIHILHTLYDKVMDHDKDVFVLSKGHAALALYVVLAERGLINPEELSTIGKKGSRLGGHPDSNKVPGVLASTGSLGTGIGMAVGMAMSMRMKGEDGRVFCLVGDGEMQEGSSLEAIEAADEFCLNNLKIIVDVNQTGHTSQRGWISEPCKLGELEDALRDGDLLDCALFVETIKGHGVLAMEQNPEAWHRRKLTDEDYTQFMMEISDDFDGLAPV